MPNGVDKNLYRLLAACAAYRQRYDQWPTQARMHPLVLHDLAGILDGEQFVKLAVHLQLRTKDDMDISVGGRGVVSYSDVDHARVNQDVMLAADQWLDIHIRRDLDH
jgi:hypothetical protein